MLLGAHHKYCREKESEDTLGEEVAQRETQGWKGVGAAHCVKRSVRQADPICLKGSTALLDHMAWQKKGELSLEI